MTVTESPVDGRSLASARRWSVRALLFCLVLACLLPGIIGASLVFYQEYRDGRAQLERDTSQTVRALAQAVDTQIQKVTVLAQGLATANSLAAGDFEDFRQRARRLMETTGLGAVAILADAQGRQLVNTGTGFGAELPPHGNPDMIRRVFATGKPVVSDLFLSRTFFRQVMNVAVPVVIDGRVTYALTISVLPQTFAALLDGQGLPPGWVATILDGQSTIVARSREPEKYVGDKPAEEFLQRRGTSAEGALEFVMKDGVSVLSVYTRSPLSGWSVAVNIPLDALEGRLLRRIAMMGLGVAALFAIGLALAWYVARRIARSFRALRAPALALGAGRTPQLPSVEVREAVEVAQAMREAAALLEQRTAALRQSEIRLQTLTRHAPAAIAIFDREMRYLAVSRRWCENFKLDGKDIIGRSHYDIFPDFPDRWKEAHRRGLAGEVISNPSDHFERRDGSVDWVSWELWPWQDDSGAIGGIVIASEDITERKEAEMRVQVSEEKYRTLFSNMTEGFNLGEVVYDAHGRPADLLYLEVNDAFYRQTGLARDITGRPASQFLPRLEQAWLEILAKVVETGMPVRFTEFNADTQRYYSVYVFRPSPGRFAGLFQDVTDNKRVEAALQESERNLRQLIDTLPGMVWTARPDGWIDYVSQQWLDYTGTTLDSQLGKGAQTSLHPDDRGPVAEQWARSVAGRSDFNVEFRLRRHDGAYGWFKSRGTPVFDADGRPVRWLGIVIDIDEQKRANEALQESESRFRLMADCAPVLIWLAGADRLCNWFNQHWLAFTGRRMEQEIGNGWTEGVHPDDLECCLRTYEGAFEERRAFAMEYRLRRHDGEYRWIIDRGAPRFAADGIFAGYVGTCMDITDMKEARDVVERLNGELERRVQERTAELLAANRELEGFTFATSHDLRGPLGRINSFSAMLEQQYRHRLEGDGLVFLDFIRQNAIRLTHLVDDLLNHARVAQQDLELQPVDVLATVQACLRDKAEEIRNAKAEIRLDLAAARLWGDPHALQQALNNLLDNALKYSASADPPVVEIGGRADGGSYRLWVRDNGIGFDMAYHDKIFEIFRRLHTYSEYPGTGIGLALVKRAIERSGGRVWAQSRPAAGATFFVELPLAGSEGPAASGQPALAAAG